MISADDLDLLHIGESDEFDFAKSTEPDTRVQRMEVDMAQVKDDVTIKLADSDAVSTWKTLPGPHVSGSSPVQHSTAHTTHSGFSASKQSMHSRMDLYESSMASVVKAINAIQQTLQQSNSPSHAPVNINQITPDKLPHDTLTLPQTDAHPVAPAPPK